MAFVVDYCCLCISLYVYLCVYMSICLRVSWCELVCVREYQHHPAVLQQKLSRMFIKETKGKMYMRLQGIPLCLCLLLLTFQGSEKYEGISRTAMKMDKKTNTQQAGSCNKHNQTRVVPLLSHSFCLKYQQGDQEYSQEGCHSLCRQITIIGIPVHYYVKRLELTGDIHILLHRHFS